MKIGIVGNTSKPKALETITRFADMLEKHHVSCIYADDLVHYLDLPHDAEAARLDELGNHCSVVVSFGGDGTILSTAKKIGASGTPILGVNVGTLGFLTEIVIGELEETILDLLNNRYTIIERMVLHIRIEKDGLLKSYYALNDVVLDRGLGSRLIYIDAHVNGIFLNSYRADGLIVATPTGSTAYSLSAGGPLVMPDMHAFIITPICPHSINVRPIVLAQDSVITLSIRKEAEPVQVNFDGQNRDKLMADETVRITRADYNLRWISMGKRDFFSVLRTKLYWGADNNRNQSAGEASGK